MRFEADRDRGSAIVLVTAALLLAAVSGLMLGRMTEVMIDRAQATTAADAAALAGVLAGREAAVEAAERNGAALVDFSTDGRIARVIVEVGRARATATAERAIGASP
jgi:hypothetical protein